MQTNPVLESFGNAMTARATKSRLFKERSIDGQVRNNNSSRFGKWPGGLKVTRNGGIYSVSRRFQSSTTAETWRIRVEDIEVLRLQMTVSASMTIESCTAGNRDGFSCHFIHLMSFWSSNEVTDYLLELTRVCSQGSKERSWAQKM